MVKTKKTTSNQSAKNLIQLQQQIDTLTDRLNRSLADYANLERRIESQRQLFITLATTAIVTRMIEVLDDLNLSYKYLQDQGLKIAIDKFISVLKSEGVEEIVTENQEFDPQTMECIEIVEGKNNYVISVKKLGYKLNGHVIRPAQVAVGKSDPITN